MSRLLITSARTAGCRHRVSAAEPRSARLGGRTLRFEVMEVRALLANVIYWMEQSNAPVGQLPIQLGDWASYDVATLTNFGDSRVRLIANGQVFESPGPLYAVGLATFGGDDVVDASGLTTTIAVLYGGAGSDRLIGGNAGDYLIGGPGHDWLEGGPGGDHLWGEDGVDVLVGNRLENGNYADGVTDYLDGGCGAADYIGFERVDSVVPDNVPWIRDYLFEAVYVPPPSVPLPPPELVLPTGWNWCQENGLFQFDAALVSIMTVGVVNPTTIHVTWNDNAGLNFSPLTGVIGYGTEGSDNFSFAGLGVPVTIYGRGGNDTITGGNAADVIYGGSGDDTLFGGPGDDTLVGDAGNDVAYGGAGADWFRFVDAVVENDYAPDFSPAQGDTMERDPGGASEVQVIDSWNDQTGVATIQGTTVSLVEVTYVGVDGIFYDLYINGVKRPQSRRANGVIGITVVDTLDNVQIDEPLRTHLLDNNWLVLNTVPGGVAQPVDPLRG